MVFSIHQPNYIPWIGYFYKISQSDVFVFLDDVQYTKNSFINRNKIKTPNGPQWLTMPVQAPKLHNTIKETFYFEKQNNVKKIKRSLEVNYSKAKYFHDYFDSFCKCLDTQSDIVSVYNRQVLIWLMEQFGITTELRVSSEIENVVGSGTEKLISIIKNLGGDVYLSGIGGANYQDEQLFASNGIKLRYSDFTHPVYPQLYGHFCPYLSAIDFLFNVGPQCKEFFHQVESSPILEPRGY